MDSFDKTITSLYADVSEKQQKIYENFKKVAHTDIGSQEDIIGDIRSRLDTDDLYDLDMELNDTMRQYGTDFDNTLRFMALKEQIVEYYGTELNTFARNTITPHLLKLAHALGVWNYYQDVYKEVREANTVNQWLTNIETEFNLLKPLVDRTANLVDRYRNIRLLIGDVYNAEPRDSIFHWRLYDLIGDLDDGVKTQTEQNTLAQLLTSIETRFNALKTEMDANPDDVLTCVHQLKMRMSMRFRRVISFI